MGRTLGGALLALGLLMGTARAEHVVNVMAGDGFQYAIQHIAERGGFFKQEGLDVESVDANSGARQAAALMGGSAAFGGFGLVQAIKADAEGGDLVAFCAMLQSYDQQVVLSNAALAKTGITEAMSLDERVKRLNGISVAITSPGSTTDIIMRALLKLRGMDADQSLKLLPMGGGSNMLAAMQNHATDAFLWAAPQAQMAVAQGIGKIVVNPLSGEVPEMNGVSYLAMTTSHATLKNKPEVIRAAVRALTKAMQFTHEQPDKARELLRQQFPDVDPAVFNTAWAGYLKVIPTTPVIGKDEYAKTIAWLNITAKPAVSTPYETAIDNTAANAVAAELLKK